jgi:uncharacterized protein (TIGR00251 family)
MHDGKRGAALTVRVTPRASRNEITEIMDNGTIKVRLTAPPVEGKANEALVNFLASILDTAPSKIDIVAGISSREKLITILDLTPEEVHQKVINALV